MQTKRAQAQETLTHVAGWMLQRMQRHLGVRSQRRSRRCRRCRGAWGNTLSSITQTHWTKKTRHVLNARYRIAACNAGSMRINPCLTPPSAQPALCQNDTPSGIDCTFISFMNCILSIVRFALYWSVCVSWNRDVSVECWMMSAKVLYSLLTLYEWLRAHAFSRTPFVQVFKLTDSSVALFATPCTRHGHCWQRCMLASLVCEASSRPSWIDWPRMDCAN